MPIVHSPKRYAYIVLLGVILAPLGLFMQNSIGGLVWSIILVVIGIAGDADHVNDNLEVTVRRWKWTIAAIVTSVITGLYYLYRRRKWFKSAESPA